MLKKIVSFFSRKNNVQTKSEQNSRLQPVKQEYTYMNNLPKNVQENLQDRSKVISLLDAAAKIIVEFDVSGGELQANSDGVFDRTTAIEKLRTAIRNIHPDKVFRGEYLAPLSEEQIQRLREVAIEVQKAGNGTGDEDDEESRINAETHVAECTPMQVLEMLPDNRDWLGERLGFDYDTGLPYEKDTE